MSNRSLRIGVAASVLVATLLLAMPADVAAGPFAEAPDSASAWGASEARIAVMDFFSRVWEILLRLVPYDGASISPGG